MKNKIILAVIICYLLTFLYCVKNDIKNEKYNMELFEVNLDDNIEKNNINAFFQLTKGNNFNLTKLNIDGNVNVIGKLTVNTGSDFSGGRHYFRDLENAGRVRIGGVDGYPGIYAEEKDIILGSSSGNINILNSIDITGKLYVKNIEVLK